MAAESDAGPPLPCRRRDGGGGRGGADGAGARHGPDGGGMGRPGRAGAPDAARLVGRPKHRDRAVHGGMGPRYAGEARRRPDRGSGGPARARAPRRIDAGGDGWSPRGAPAGRGGHGTSGTLAGRRAMMRFGRTMAMIGLVAGLAGPAARPMVAQERTADPNQIDIAQHIGNSHELELPFIGVVELPRLAPIHIGGLTVDLSPTKHLVFMLLAAAIVVLVFVLSARAISQAQAQGRPAKGFAGAMEAMALYIRQEVILPNVGPHGEGFAPFLLTLFFFILAMNLLGLLPWGATATGNIAVTAALAVIAFLVIEVTGMRTLGPKGYMKTIFYLPEGLPGGIGGSALKVLLLAVMTPIELIGKLAKPFAL